MADETSPDPNDDATKNDTIRITLPPKSETPAVKRETVRINVPGKPAAPLGTAPKKETSKLPTTGFSGGSPPAPPGPPRPPAGIGAPPSKPMAPGMPPPKPPSLGARPTVPLKPVPAAAPTAGAEPVVQKAASPKKETARITLPAEGSAKPALPKATVKMQQTQPLQARPQSAISSSPAIQAAPLSMQSSSASADPAVNPLAIAALVLALAALATAYLAYSAASAPV
ncbi:MAG: hypothetical protein ABIZ56_06585 [Chthoniobacteraceae bacterium]